MSLVQSVRVMTILLIVAFTVQLAMCGDLYQLRRNKGRSRSLLERPRKVADESPCRKALLHCNSIGSEYQSCEVWIRSEYKPVPTRQNATCHCKVRYGGSLCDQCAAGSAAAFLPFPSCLSVEEVADAMIASLLNVTQFLSVRREQSGNDPLTAMSAPTMNGDSSDLNLDAVRNLLQRLGFVYPTSALQAISSHDLLTLKHVMVEKLMLAMYTNASVTVHMLTQTANPWGLLDYIQVLLEIVGLG
jgi:hypothetical protein